MRLLLSIALLLTLCVSASAQGYSAGSYIEGPTTAVTQNLRAQGVGSSSVSLLTVWANGKEVARAGLDRRVVYAPDWNAERVYQLLRANDWNGSLSISNYKATLRDYQKRAVTFEARDAEGFMQKFADACDVLFGKYVRTAVASQRFLYAIQFNVSGVEFDVMEGKR